MPFVAPASPGQCLGLNPAPCVNVEQFRTCLCPVTQVLDGCLCSEMAMRMQRILGQRHRDFHDVMGCSFYPVFSVGVASVSLGHS